MSNKTTNDMRTYLDKYILLMLGILMLGATYTQAQKDSVLNGSVIDVVKTFKPILSESIKIPVNPNPETPDIVKTDFTYNVPLVSFQVEPTVYTIKPLTLGTMLLPKLKGNYLKMGYGNYNSPYFEAYLNTVRNKNRQAGLHYNHLSAGGDNNYNNFSQNRLNGYIKEFAEKNVYGLNVNYDRTLVNRYGFNTGLEPQRDSLKNIYNLIEVNGSYQLLSKDTTQDVTKFNAGFYHFGTNRNSRENSIQVGGLIGRAFSGIPIFIPFSVQQFSNTYNDSSLQRLYINLNPEARLSEKEFYLKAGFNSTFYNDSVGTNFHFYPKAEGGFYLIPSKLTVLAGITGNLAPHTLRSINTENPFATGIQLRNQNTTFEVYGNIKGQLGSRSSFNLFSSSANINNMLFYANDTITGRQKTIYDDGSLVKLGFEIDYHVHTKFYFALAGTVFNYKLKNLSQPFTRPGFELKFNSQYNMGDKFVFRLDVIYLNQRYGLLEGTTTQNNIKIQPFTDFNFGIDYRYNKNVSAFVLFNNIANNRYQVWLNHPVYGFNMLGGLTFTF